MSVYFSVGDREIWNPASRAGVLFYEHIRALEHVAQQPCGVADMGADAYQIIPAAFTAFLDALLDAVGRTNHAVLLALAEPTLAVGLGLEARIRGRWRTFPERIAEHPAARAEPALPFGPVQVGGPGPTWFPWTGAALFPSILERAHLLEQTFAGGEPAPRP